ncbi:hypothetical protein ACFLXE_06220 [Chloroflexota bacterium]
MKMPVETLERLSFRCKRIAALEMNLEQLRRESEITRREWWQEIDKNRSEYGTLQYDPDPFLESNFALARLKLVTSFQENGESPPPGHGFRQEETDLLKEFEQYIVYDRLSLEDIKDFVHSGAEDDRGIVALARHAAVSGYDRMYDLMQQANLPNDLALAIQRIYQDRIKKIEAAAAEIRLSETYRDIEAARAYAEATAAAAAAAPAAGPEKEITAAEARLLERSYMAQVESRLKQPTGDHQWKKVNRFSNIDRITTELKAVGAASPEGIKESMPHGLGVRAVIERGSLLFKKPVLTLEARVVSNYKELHLRGFDTTVSFGELMRNVEEVAPGAKGQPYVLALASPAGWDAESIDYVREGQSLSQGFSLALLGLKDRVVHYNPNDARLKELLPYLEVK